MKINPASQSDPISKILSVNSNANTGKKMSIDISDSVELSDSAKKYSELVKTARESMETSDAEEEAKVSDIISRMNSNTYKVADKDVANNIVGGIPSYI